MDYSKFKSGSDIRGIGFGNESDPMFLSNEMVGRCACAFYLWLASKTEKTNLRISVGHDCRVSGERISNEVVRTLLCHGADVINCGLCSTPAMFMTTVELECDGAIQITASHHPMDKNGLKFFTKEGGLDGSDISDILTAASSLESYIDKKSGTEKNVDFLSQYAGILRKMISDSVPSSDNKPLRGMKIVVDPGNGVGGFYAKDVLEPLGADVSGSVYLDPDGMFPNHIPNPENATAMNMASEACRVAKADLGIVFDTDVDRAAIVGKDGLEINRNRLVALAAAVALDSYPGGTIVTDSVTSDGLASFINSKGGKHLRFKRGYKNVINKQLELCSKGISCPLAMETSGHAAFAENFHLDDGAYLVTKLLVKAAELSKQGKALENLIDGLQEPVEEAELRFKIKSDDFKSEGEKIIRLFFEKANEISDWTPSDDNYEGIRINSNSGDGWFLLRLSVHDPIIVLNTESNSVNGTSNMLKQVYDVISKADNIALLDISSLVNSINT